MVIPDAIVERHTNGNAGILQNIVVVSDMIGLFDIIVLLQDFSGVLLPHGKFHADLVERMMELSRVVRLFVLGHLICLAIFAAVIGVSEFCKTQILSAQSI